MFKFATIFFILFLNRLIQADKIKIYGQCAGFFFGGPFECEYGNCFKYDRFYSQCLYECPLKGWSCSKALPEPEIFLKEHEQCGGENYKSKGKCDDGLKCYKFDRWYSQCLTNCPKEWECENEE